MNVNDIQKHENIFSLTYYGGRGQCTAASLLWANSQPPPSGGRGQCTGASL